MTQQPNKNPDNSPVGNAPATAASSLDQMIAASLGLAAQNAVLAQQQANILHQAATSVGIEQIYASGPSNVSDSFDKTLEQLKKVMELNNPSQDAGGTPTA